MKKVFALVLSVVLLSVFLCSCKPENTVSSGSADTDSSNSQTLSSIPAVSDAEDESSDIVTSNEKEETESKSPSKPVSSNKSDKSSSSKSSTTSKKPTSSNKTETPTTSTKPTPPVIIPTTEDYKEIKPVNSENYYGWQYLKKKGTAAEQKAYKAFEKAFSTCEKKVEFDFKVSTSEVTRAYEIYMDDHPEDFFLGAASYTTNAGDVVSFTVTSDIMALGKDKAMQMRSKALNKANEIVLKLFPNGVYKNEIETVRLVHDYLVNNIKYDKTHKADNSHNMYGALINGTSVCEGYAEAFMYIMRACGIECIIAKGAMGSENHEWNMVKLDGNWYHIDVTSDDPILKSNEQVLRFEYFNLTDTEIKKTHVIKDNIFDLPKATSTKHNFFKYYGLEYSSLNNDAFIYSISFSMKNGYNTAYFKFTNNTPNDAVDYYLDHAKAIADIVNNNKYNKKIDATGSVSYSQNKDKKILNLKLKYQ